MGQGPASAPGAVALVGTADRRQYPQPLHALSLHIGVNTGTVVAGDLNVALGGAYAVTGDTVNTTARLQAAAAPDQILVSRDTYRRTRDAFSYTELDPIIVKGKSDYPERTEETDDRFSTVNVPITSIAVSTGQNDSGVFEVTTVSPVTAAL